MRLVWVDLLSCVVLLNSLSKSNSLSLASLSLAVSKNFVEPFTVIFESLQKETLGPWSMPAESDATASKISLFLTSTINGVLGQGDKVEETLATSNTLSNKEGLWNPGIIRNKINEEKLSSYQKEASEIALSFQPKKFNPVPFLSNQHVQTIASVFVRDIPECAYVNDDIGETMQALWKFTRKKNNIEGKFWDRREKIETPDNDWFHADYKFVEPGKNSEKGVAIVIHGLESNSLSPLSRDIADAHLAQGLDVICLNFRGCSGIPNDSLAGYHLGFTDDLIYFLDRLVRRDSNKNTSDRRPIFLSGFSLGANVMIKALGELKHDAVDVYNIQGATALCSPIDIEQTYPMLQKPGINKMVYTNTLLKSLQKRTEAQLQMHCNGDANTEEFDYKRAMNAETITDYDDAFIAPIYGFDGAIDYYRKTSCTYFMEDVAVPFLILNAKDDPFLSADDFPVEKSAEYGGRAPVKMIHSQQGGHAGFTFHQLEKGEERPRNSFAPSEMGRFVQHVMQSRNSNQKDIALPNVKEYATKLVKQPNLDTFAHDERELKSDISSLASYQTTTLPFLSKFRFERSYDNLLSSVINPQDTLFEDVRKPTRDLRKLTIKSLKSIRDMKTVTQQKIKEFKFNSYQKKAADIAKSFKPGKFKPVFLLSNCHIQTIAGVFFREVPELAYIGSNIQESIQAFRDYGKTEKYVEDKFWDRRDKINTPDGDWFHADYKFIRSGTSKGTAIVLHGLESNSKSPLTRDIANAHLSLGLDVVCLNFRGCSGVPNDTVGGYHLGFTDDLLYFLDKLPKNSGPIYLSGFSLGSNVMIKALGELGSDAIEKHNIQGATALCCPLDVEKSYQMLEKPGINRSIYTGNLLKSMKNRAKDQLNLHCDSDPDTNKFDYKSAIEAKTIYDYEDAVIAKIYGFDDPIDYYRKASCVYYLEKLTVPVLILNAKDDPFFNPDYFPTEKSAERGGRSPVKMVRYKNGGHCGFVFHQLDKGQERPKVSWAPSEMGRFVEHVMQQNESEATVST